MIDTSYYTSEALTLLHSLIGIPSISREEEAAADFLQNYIEETGIMTGRSGNRNSPGISSVCLVIKRNRDKFSRLESMTPFSRLFLNFR